MASPPERRRAARQGQPDVDGATRRGSSAGRKKPITVDLIVETALGIIEREGFSALTMRRVAGALETGPASLYAHVVNKEDLDDLLIGRICTEIVLPKPDSRIWREQIIGVCTQLRDVYLRYPGISLAALGVAPTNLETLRVNEGMLAIVLSGGVSPQTAAWAIDALTLYVNGFCLETSLVARRAEEGGWMADRDELLRRFRALPDTYPYSKRHAAELTNGAPSDRFEFTLELMVNGLDQR